jgi:3-methyladenine DNA glycosylase/8-oxoguanine DNA glycosylase
MTSLLVEKLGRASKSGAHAFPSAEAIGSKSEKWLADECRVGYRARYLRELARGVTSGSIDLASVARQDVTTPELIASYRTLPGIGPYGAAHLAAMDGRHDFIAVDTEFRRFVRERYFGGEPVDDATLLARYEKWGRWKYLAYWSELWSDSAREKGLF